jgi:tetratricopeptide (TPR) repeat protein/lysophospholipase L1-like esterase
MARVRHIKSRLRRWGKPLLALAGLLLALGLAEVLTRLSGLTPEIKPIWLSKDDNVYERSDNAILGFELKANYRTHAGSDVRSHFDTNSHGQRDIERLISKRPETRRVILSGDSVVEGHGLTQVDDTISRQLEQLYPDGSTEVMNFGVSGYCTRAEIELLDVKGLKFSPDIVVLVFVENDFDNFNPETFALQRNDRPGWVKQLFVDSHVFRATCLGLDLFSFRSDFDPASWNHHAIGDNNVVDGLQRFSRLSRDHGFVPLIAIWPRFENEKVDDVHPLPGSSGELVIERLASSHHIRSVRLSEYFKRDYERRGQPLSPRLLYTVGDGMHPSIEGSRIAATALKDVLSSVENVSSSGSLAEQAVVDSSPDVEAVEAVEIARSLGTKQRPNYHRIYNNEGNRLLLDGKPDQAAAFYRRAIHEQPNSVEAHTNLGKILQKQDRLTEAVEHFSQALTANPDFADAHVNLANALVLLRDFEGALHHYLAVVDSQSPEIDAVHLNIGLIQMQKRRLKPALEHFDQAERFARADDAEFRLRLARCYFDLSSQLHDSVDSSTEVNSTSAVEVLEKAARLVSPDSPAASEIAERLNQYTKP